MLAAVTTAQDEQLANVAEFDRIATPQQVSLYNSTVSGGLVDYASEYEQQAITYGDEGMSLSLSRDHSRAVVR